MKTISLGLLLLNKLASVMSAMVLEKFLVPYVLAWALLAMECLQQLACHVVVTVVSSVECVMVRVIEIEVELFFSRMKKTIYNS